MSEFFNVSWPFVLNDDDEQAQPTLSEDVTITRFAVTVSIAPTGGDAVVRIQNESGASPTGYVEATIPNGLFTGVGNGSFNLTAGNAPYFRVVTGNSAEILTGLATYYPSELLPTGGELTTLALVKSLLGLTTSADDDYLNSLISGVSEAMKRKMHNNIVQSTYSGEVSSGDGWSNVLRLRNAPLIRPPAPVISVNGTAVDETTLVYNDEAGLVYFASGAAWAHGVRNISAAYSAGYAAVPVSLQQGAAHQVVFLFKQSARKGDRLGEQGQILEPGGSATFIVREWIHECEQAMRPFTRML